MDTEKRIRWIRALAWAKVALFSLFVAGGAAQVLRASLEEGLFDLLIGFVGLAACVPLYFGRSAWFSAESIRARAAAAARRV